MDHDRFFKELLTTFIHEFIALFLPGVAAYLDPAVPVEFLDKEVFTDIASSESHEVDLIAKARFLDYDGFFLIHVENQASIRPGFPKRMFSYFSRLLDKHDLPVYPVVLFSHDTPRKQEPENYNVAFPDKTVLQFEYTVIQLNRLSWRDYIDRHNPVATALMAKMQVETKDRPKVKVECLRLLATQKLDPARTKLIGTFIESYLKLSSSETSEYDREFAQLAPADKEATMEMTTSWHQRGREEGIQAGKEELVVRLINRRLGLVPTSTLERVDQLKSEQLNELGDALFDFESISDLDAWLVQYGE